MALSRIVVVFALLGLLAACESDDERAEGHFENGMALYEAGDVDRALVEFRNVLALKEGHGEARLVFARIQRERGNMRSAVDSYIRVVEQNPDVVEGQIALAEIAAFTQAWDDAERHGRAALALAPDDTDVQVVNAVLDYRQALLDRDDEARATVLSRAEALAVLRPDSVILRNILIDGRNWQGDLQGALAEVDLALAIEPDHQPLYYSKLSILGAIGDEPAIEAHLREMVTRFPDDEEIKGALIRYLVSTGDMEKAEAFFREVADPNGAEVGPYVAYVRFLSETRGPEAAIAELEATADASVHSFVLRAMRAGLKFDTGARDAAIAEMEAVLADEPPTGMAGNLKVALAQMLAVTGNEVGARRRVEEVLAEDPGNAEALKLRAVWLIEADRPDEAIAALRTALDEEPGDVEAITRLASAYSRAGSHDLARDTLGLAVTASNAAPGPSLRYAAALLETRRFRPAESILVTALRNAPQDIDLLRELGRLYLTEGDFARGRGVVGRLETIGTPAALETVESLRLGLLAAEERTDELLAALEGMAEGADAGATALLIRTRLMNGDAAGALAAAEEARAAAPDDPAARLTLAATRAATGDAEGAMAEYRAMVSEGEANARTHQLLAVALLRSGDLSGGRAALAEGRAAFPDDGDLMWFEASLLEQDGDIDGAIAVYEQLYKANSGSPIVANNLASLLATWRADDPASIERAFAIARRLNGTDIPAFQDTYGWILHLRGDSGQALDYLAPAAAALADDAIVQYHFAMALLAAGRDADAAEQFRRALAAAPEDDSRPQIEMARAELARLDAGTGTETNSEN